MTMPATLMRHSLKKEKNIKNKTLDDSPLQEQPYHYIIRTFYKKEPNKYIFYINLVLTQAEMVNTGYQMNGSVKTFNTKLVNLQILFP